jgi:signal transduction histidine kinase
MGSDFPDADEARQEVEEFVYVASHDLKAPLRDIRNLTELLLEDVADSLPETGRQWLSLIGERVERMQRLLDDLLDYSRAGRIRTPCETFDCTEAVSSAIALAGCPSTFNVVVPDDGPSICTPRAPLETILRNLIGNAAKHHTNEAGTARIEIASSDEFVQFSVIDDGPGIPRRHHHQVFQMFYTLRPRDEVEGTGMGLALTKKLVEAFGGTVALTSAEGEGCRFDFTWPKRWNHPGGETPSFGSEDE